jgi:hypothetical protein
MIMSDLKSDFKQKLMTNQTQIVLKESIQEKMRRGTIKEVKSSDLAAQFRKSNTVVQDLKSGGLLSGVIIPPDDDEEKKRLMTVTSSEYMPQQDQDAPQ